MILNERAYTHMSLSHQQTASTKDSSIDDYNTTKYYKNKLFCEAVSQRLKLPSWDRKM